MKTLEIVFGNSSYNNLKKCNLKNSNILMINTSFNIGDISNISNYKIIIPNELYLDSKNNNIKEETNIILNSINKKNKIRVWTSKENIYSYLIMLYISDIIKDYNYELNVIYSDNYNKDFKSISMMTKEEIKDLIKSEHKLTKKEIDNNSKLWKKLVKENSELRIIENGIVKSVSLDYYDEYILNTLNKLGKVKVNKLIGNLIKDIYLQDTLYLYLIKKLMSTKKIKMNINNNTIFTENLIEVNNE